ncbi:MAG: hypothetical protein IRY90_13855 [Actinomadura rubrobrunea]|nr:hypothetical protein [Actinomadura rubrobrunea]
MTFYSLTGGVGGTTAIANCAALLAVAGKNVLVVDWDLAAPRVHEYLRPFLDTSVIEQRGGLIGLVRQFGARQSHAASGDPADALDVPGHVMRLSTDELGLPGRLDYLPPMDAADLLRRYTFWHGWDERPREVDLDVFAAALRRSLLATAYDYVLVDVPYGSSAAAHAATEMLCDVLVTGLQPVPDSISRTAELVRRVHSTSPVVRVVPVLMRVDKEVVQSAEFDRVLTHAAQRFAWLLPEGKRYWERNWIPTATHPQHFEQLVVLANPDGADRELVAAYRRLVAELTGRRDLVDVKVPLATCEAYRLTLSRSRHQTTTACVLAARTDRVWADWLTAELRRIGVQINPPPVPGQTVNADRLIVVGATRPGGDPPWTQLRLSAECQVIALRTARHSSFAGLRVTREIDMRRLNEESARAALEELFDAVAASSHMRAGPLRRRLTPRFPGRSVDIRDLPPANRMFVGRQNELDTLRDRLLVAEAVRADS